VSPSEEANVIIDCRGPGLLVVEGEEQELFALRFDPELWMWVYDKAVGVVKNVLVLNDPNPINHIPTASELRYGY
jgi:hypothetical protein